MPTVLQNPNHVPAAAPRPEPTEQQKKMEQLRALRSCCNYLTSLHTTARDFKRHGAILHHRHGYILIQRDTYTGACLIRWGPTGEEVCVWSFDGERTRIFKCGAWLALLQIHWKEMLRHDEAQARRLTPALAA